MLGAACPLGSLEPGGPSKIQGSHIDASHSRQPLVKGERLVRYEVNAVMRSWAPKGPPQLASLQRCGQTTSAVSKQGVRAHHGAVPSRPAEILGGSPQKNVRTAAAPKRNRKWDSCLRPFRKEAVLRACWSPAPQHLQQDAFLLAPRAAALAQQLLSSTCPVHSKRSRAFTFTGAVGFARLPKPHHHSGIVGLCCWRKPRIHLTQ